MKWQPIETAPKRQRLLLAFANGFVTVGFHGPKFSTYGSNYGDSWGRGTDWSEGFGEAPTHWMPLPKPPLSPDEEAQSADTGSQQERGQPDTEDLSKVMP